MRALLIMWVLLALGGCRKEEPLDCTKIDMERELRCFDENRAKGEAESAVACLHFSKQLKTSGIWVVGFEKNDFFEGWGQRPPPADIMWTASTGASLIVNDAVRQKVAPPGPGFYAFEVDVVGRRALCPVGGIIPYPIAVEQLKVKRRIGVR